MSLVTFSIRRRVTIAMATVTVLLFGFIGLSELRVNLLPDLSYPTLTVRTEYTGAAPAEIETLITEPVEESVGVVKNLRRLRSISRTGQSDVVLEFAWGTDMDQAGLEVRDKLQILQLPLEAEQPTLLRFDPSTEPVMRLSLAGADGATLDESALRRLRRYADEELKKRLEPVAGVAAVKVGGGLEDEIQVLLDQQRLAQLNLPVATVISRLQQENVNISGGRIEDGAQRYQVRTVNQFAEIEQIREMLVVPGSVDPLASGATGPADGRPVRLRDIATVEQGSREREGIIRLAGREAIEVAIYKEGDANTVEVADGVRAALERLREQLPEGATLETIEDQSVFIQSAISGVKGDALLGGCFAILVILLFLRDGWSTFVIGVSLPVSLIATFFFMAELGLSLNVMSLGGLALATGLVVDDSIVVLESIAKARERGLGILESVVVGANEVGMVVVASTATTVAVFLPLVFVEGIAGQLFRDQALTISIAVINSTFVALTLVPMLSSLKAKVPTPYNEEGAHEGRLRSAPAVIARSAWRMLRWPLGGQGGRAKALALFVLALPVKAFIAFVAALALLVTIVGGGLLWVLSAFVGLVRRLFGGSRGRGLVRLGDLVMKPYDLAAAGYARLLPGALDRPALVLGVAAVMLAVSALLVPRLGLDLIPQLAQDRFEMTLKLPAGTQLATTDAHLRALQLGGEPTPGVRLLYGVSGTGTRLDANPTESGDNIGQLSIVLEHGVGPEVERLETERLRALAARIPDAEVSFGRPEVFSFAPPLQLELYGQDLPTLEAAGRRLAERLTADPRFADVRSTVQQGFPEIQIRFDQERAAALGLTTREIADLVVRQVRGEVATRYSVRDRKIDVLVRAREADRDSLQAIRDLFVNPQAERPVTLASVASVELTTGPSEIHRIDQGRVAVISSNLASGDLGSAIAAVRAMLAEEPLPPGVTMLVGGQGEELDESVTSLVFAFALAVFLVYLVMASQFESLLHPFVIMFTIPLALVGAVLALWGTGSPLSIVVFIGLILLAGIVVKNAIVLIDRVNQLREAGTPKREAMLEGASERLRPIVMTTLTTLVGFAPLAMGGGDGAEVRAPMAIAVIGGLLVSTLLTLVVIPVVYSLLDRRSDAWYAERGERARALAAAEASALAEGHAA